MNYQEEINRLDEENRAMLEENLKLNSKIIKIDKEPYISIDISTINQRLIDKYTSLIENNIHIRTCNLTIIGCYKRIIELEIKTTKDESRK